VSCNERRKEIESVVLCGEGGGEKRERLAK
jgi:hypothetical protein